MSGPVKNRVGTNVRGNECPGFELNSLSKSNALIVFQLIVITFVNVSVDDFIFIKELVCCWENNKFFIKNGCILSKIDNIIFVTNVKCHYLH